MDQVSKSLIIFGGLFVVMGLLWHFSGGKIALFNLPGDIRIHKGNTSIFIPITSSLIISGLLSLIGYLLKK